MNIRCLLRGHTWGPPEGAGRSVVHTCTYCGKTGYRGRFAIHEVLTVTEEIERLIVDREHSEDIKKMAVAQGMLTLRQAGLVHVQKGTTSIEEILRVVA